MKNKFLSLLLIVLVLIENAANVFAQEDTPYLSKKTFEENGYVIIDSEEKAKELAEEDMIKLQEERALILSKIPYE